MIIIIDSLFFLFCYCCCFRFISLEFPEQNRYHSDYLFIQKRNQFEEIRNCSSSLYVFSLSLSLTLFLNQYRRKKRTWTLLCLFCLSAIFFFFILLLYRNIQSEISGRVREWEREIACKIERTHRGREEGDRNEYFKFISICIQMSDTNQKIIFKIIETNKRTWGFLEITVLHNIYYIKYHLVSIQAYNFYYLLLLGISPPASCSPYSPYSMLPYIHTMYNDTARFNSKIAVNHQPRIYAAYPHVPYMRL